MNSKLVIYVTLFVCFFAMSNKITAQPIPKIIDGTELTDTYHTPKQRAKDGNFCNGDLNNDGEITPKDALIAFQSYLMAGDYPDCVDVNRDNKITPADALCIFQKYLNQPSCLDDIEPTEPPPLSEFTLTLQKGVAGFIKSKDTFITPLWDGDDNMGGANYLECYKEDVDRARILIYFDIEGYIPDEGTILNARVELYNINTGYDESPQEISAYRLTSEWLEGTGFEDSIFEEESNQSGAYWTYSGNAPWNGGSFDPTLLNRINLPGRPDPSSTMDDQWYSWDITDTARLWHDGSADNYGIILIGDGAGEYTGHHFHSNESPNPNYRPRLIITYTSIEGIVITNITTETTPPETTTPETTPPQQERSAIIIDHSCTDISKVPSEWIDRAKNNLRVWYGHTSHGSQITSGMEAMYSNLYSFTSGNEIIPNSLSYQEIDYMDLGYDGSLDWRDSTISQLISSENNRNLIMWSWCGGVSENTEAGINIYLQAMNQLEIDYPEVTFIYMTGHLDGTGKFGNLHTRNNQIREFCRSNEKILFDFADIESYDPDGNYYLDRGATDECYYDNWQRNWAQEWCANNHGECSSYECAHSDSLNCDLKARAFWWMLARIAGWDSETSSNLSSVSVPSPDISSDLPTELLNPNDFVYLGAFRLPDSVPGASDAEGWEYGGEALAYRPDGDPYGDEDGFPGSLFGTGHDVHNYVSEITIPVPSTSRDLNQLNTATTIQEFHDIRGGLFDSLNELPRVGLEYLPPQNGQTSAKLFMAWGQHFQDDGEPSFIPSHAWCDLDLSHPNTKGAWWIGYESLYSTNGYLFSIPQEWADIYTGGATLATGRFRDGGWSGKGLSLFAYGPWLEGNPPNPGTHLNAYTLLLYSNSRGDDPSDFKLNDYHDSDEWEGGAWITSGVKTAVIFVGTKGGGDYCWYGYTSPGADGMPCVHTVGTDMCYSSNGTECGPELTAYCENHIDESRGWWSSRFDSLILFYDPSDFAQVTNGTMEPYEPQPYARLDIDEHLFLNAEIETTNIGTGDQRRYRVGEMAYDRERNFLYIFERFADGAKPVVHVWAIRP